MIRSAYGILNRCVPFETMSSQFRLTQVDSSQVINTSQEKKNQTGFTLQRFGATTKNLRTSVNKRFQFLILKKLKKSLETTYSTSWISIFFLLHYSCCLFYEVSCHQTPACEHFNMYTTVKQRAFFSSSAILREEVKYVHTDTDLLAMEKAARGKKDLVLGYVHSLGTQGTRQ